MESSLIGFEQMNHAKHKQFALAAGKHGLPIRRNLKYHRQPNALVPSGMRDEVLLPGNQLLQGRDRREALHGRHRQGARDHPEHAARGRGRHVRDHGVVGLADEDHVVLLDHHGGTLRVLLAHVRQWPGGQWRPLRDGGSPVGRVALPTLAALETVL